MLWVCVRACAICPSCSCRILAAKVSLSTTPLHPPRWMHAPKRLRRRAAALQRVSKLCVCVCLHLSCIPPRRSFMCFPVRQNWTACPHMQVCYPCPACIPGEASPKLREAWRPGGGGVETLGARGPGAPPPQTLQELSYQGSLESPALPPNPPRSSALSYQGSPNQCVQSLCVTNSSLQTLLFQDSFLLYPLLPHTMSCVHCFTLCSFCFHRANTDLHQCPGHAPSKSLGFENARNHPGAIYIYIYIYMYTYICIYTYTYYIYICIRVYITHIYIYIHILKYSRNTMQHG